GGAAQVEKQAIGAGTRGGRRRRGRAERRQQVLHPLLAEAGARGGKGSGVAIEGEDLGAGGAQQRGMASAADGAVDGAAAAGGERGHGLGQHGYVKGGCDRRLVPSAPDNDDGPACRGRRSRGLHPATRVQAGLTGLEPATSGVTDRHSNQLSYSPLRRSVAI